MGIGGALALAVMPTLGVAEVAGAAIDPTGAGNVCEAAPQPEPFSDVGQTDPAQAEIGCLYSTEITAGVTGTTYEPNSPVTRRHMALFLTRFAAVVDTNASERQTEPLAAGDGEVSFSDIGTDDIAFDAIDTLADAGVVQGFQDGTFGPNEDVTRRQMAKFLVRVQQQLAGPEVLPADPLDAFGDDDGDSGEDQLNVLAAEGVFQGDATGQVNPGDDISRRQMAFVLTRKLQYLLETGVIGQVFTDAPDGENPDDENPDAEDPDGENPGGEDPAGDGPVITADDADAGDTTFTVTFDQAVDPETAADTGNYTVSNAADCDDPVEPNPVTGATVTSAADAAQTVVELNTQEPLSETACLNQTVSDADGDAGDQIGYDLTDPTEGVADEGPTVSLVIEGTPTTTSEDGETDTFTVALSDEPTADVLVILEIDPQEEGDDEVEVSDTMLNFTPDNWDTPKTVTVTGLDDDGFDDGDSLVDISLTVNDASADEYDDVSAIVENTNIDDDDSPEFEGVAFSGNVAIATFSEELNCGTVDLEDFTVEIGGPRDVDAVACEVPSDATIEVTFGGAPSTTGTLNLVDEVTVPAGNGPGSPLTRIDNTP